MQETLPEKGLNPTLCWQGLYSYSILDNEWIVVLPHNRRLLQLLNSLNSHGDMVTVSASFSDGMETFLPYCSC